jgi:hypothetical protein
MHSTAVIMFEPDTSPHTLSEVADTRTFGISLARAGLVAAAVAGCLPCRMDGGGYHESEADVRSRMGANPWHRSGMCLEPGEIVTSWSEVSRRVISRIGVLGIYDSLVLPYAVARQLGLT